MKKLNLNIILFVLTLTTVGLINLIYFGQGNTSDLENRALQAKPTVSLETLFNGQLFQKYENYFSDHFAFRDQLISLSSDLKELKGIYSDVLIVANNGANLAESNPNVPAIADSDLEGAVSEQEKTNNTEEANNSKEVTNQEIKNSAPEDQPKAPVVSPTQKQGTVIGSMLIADDKAMEIYRFNRDTSLYYTSVVNSLAEKVGGKVKVYSLLVPTQIEFLDQNKYKKAASSQKDALEFINSNFNQCVLPVNTYDELSTHREDYLYFRTDHHWTALGAYYAYKAFAEAIDLKPVALEDYEVGKVEGFLGSTYSATLNKKLKANPDTIYYYKPFIKHEYFVYYQGPLKMNVIDLNQTNQQNKYRIFLSGDRPLGKIVTEVKTDQKIMVIKDSYGNAFVPFLIPHYKEIYIVDPRQFKSNVVDFIKEKGINDVLVLDYIPAANNKSFIDLIKAMME